MLQVSQYIFIVTVVVSCYLIPPDLKLVPTPLFSVVYLVNGLFFGDKEFVFPVIMSGCIE